jgi:hypothetical protein
MIEEEVTLKSNYFPAVMAEWQHFMLENFESTDLLSFENLLYFEDGHYF